MSSVLRPVRFDLLCDHNLTPPNPRYISTHSFSPDTSWIEIINMSSFKFIKLKVQMKVSIKNARVDKSGGEKEEKKNIVPGWARTTNLSVNSRTR